jgi:hypothetical protein
MADVPLTLGSRIIPVAQLSASKSNSSQGLNCSSPLTHSLTNQLALLHCTNSVKSQSQSYFTAGTLPPISSPWRQAPWDSRHSNFIFQLNTCDYRPYVIFSMTRGWGCRLQLLLGHASAVILRSESRRTHDHILLSQIPDSPKLEGLVSVFISRRNRVARLYPQALSSLFVASYDS